MAFVGSGLHPLRVTASRARRGARVCAVAATKADLTPTQTPSPKPKPTRAKRAAKPKAPTTNRRKTVAKAAAAPAIQPPSRSELQAQLAGLFIFSRFADEGSFGRALMALLAALEDESSPAVVSHAYSRLWNAVVSEGRGWDGEVVDILLSHAGVIGDAAQAVAVQRSSIVQTPEPPPPAPKKRGRKKKNPDPEPVVQVAHVPLPPPSLLADQQVKATDIDQNLCDAALWDIGVLQALFQFNLETLRNEVSIATASSAPLPLIPRSGVDLAAENDGTTRLRTRLCEKLGQAPQDSSKFCSSILEDIVAHCASQGTGLVGRYYGFRWDTDTSSLTGVLSADEVSSSPELAFVGLEHILERLHTNTEFLMHGYKSLNALLYGPPGCGKSTMVRSLLSTFGDRGLRIVEVSKPAIRQMPIIVERLSSLPQKFIVFIDDLSFEDSEAEAWRESKAALEGSLQMSTQNVTVYVTSNRRYPVGDALTDGTKEKIAFAHRFGIVLGFGTTTRQQYLNIVHRLAAESNLDIDHDALEDRALQWALGMDGNSNGLSGRTARQFVDNIASEQALRGGSYLAPTVGGGYSNWSLNWSNQN